MQSPNLEKAEGVPLQFVYEFELERDGVIVDSWEQVNIVPLAGVNYMAAALFGDVAPIGTFYVGLFENNYLPVPAALSSDLPATIGEFTGYSEGTRPIWNRVNTNGLITNIASRAAFTVTASKRLYGGFLVSSSEKAGVSGLLLSVARFDTPRDVEAGMVLRVRAELNLIPTNIV